MEGSILSFECDTRKDEAFNELKLNEGLTWLPWVGKNYWQTHAKCKLLIIGESHYNWIKPDCRNFNDKQYSMVKAWMEDSNFTRDFITLFKDEHSDIELVNWVKENKNFPCVNILTHKEKREQKGCTENDIFIENAYNNEKILRNLERAFFLQAYPSSEIKTILWEHVSYYNFIQKILDSSNDRNISDIEWENSWNIFYKIINILRPTHCLFCGVGIADSFKNSGNEFQISEAKNKKSPDISNLRPVFERKNKDKTSLLFIRHPSAYFSWNKWGEFVEKQWPDLIFF
jgi:hypothetical protein